jgi:hypothetical protein
MTAGENLRVRQAEVFNETMMAIAVEVRGETSVGRRTEIARQGFERALATMRQLAEAATESQKQTIEIVRRRFEDGMPVIQNRDGSA